MNPAFQPLSTLLSTRQHDAGSMAFTADGDARSWSQFSARVAGLIPKIEGGARGEWILCCGDAFHFAVGLFALLHSGKKVIIPANSQPGVLAEMAANRGVVSDFARLDETVPLRLDPKVSGDGQWTFEALPGTGTIQLFTSGSTGTAKTVEKQLCQLEAEVETLEAVWGDRLADAPVLASVSCQHIYGLLFRLLWPMCAGRPIYENGLAEPLALARTLGRHRTAILISSPALLRRLPESIDITQLTPCQAIFSSGGPLAQYTAEMYLDALGRAPVEVLGSTETGGIAWRSRTADNDGDLWTPLPGVDVRTDASNRLLVRSKFVSPEGDQFYETQDSIILGDHGAFRLGTRQDRIVKVEEIRVSLPAVEERLVQHEFVTECRVAALPPQFEKRITLAAVVVLSSAGDDVMNQSDGSALRRQLRDALAEYFDPVVVPRRWVFVDSISCDSQGKTSDAEILKLIGESSTATDPVIKTSHVSEHTAMFTLDVPANLAYCEGHFPEVPIVPGVVQLKWVVELGSQYLDTSVAFTGIEALKFHALLMPHDRVDLRITWHETTRKLEFCYERDGKVLASGRMLSANRPQA
jgi:3-hydroxymyristoyl/3-hydroxydecanoyl-(acyl carrier protein) dehydratase